MVNIVCDACKKPTEQVRDLTYFSILSKNLCVPCKELLDQKVRDVMYAKPAYTLPQYQAQMVEILKAMCA